MKMRSVALMRIAKYGYIALSAFFCVLGYLFIVQPEASARLLLTLLGIGMAVFGVIKIIGFFSKDLYRLAFQFDLEIGILLLLLGSTALIYPSEARSFLMIATGIITVLDSMLKIRIARDARRFGIAEWPLVSAIAIATGIAGLCLMFHPWEGANILSIVLGISLIAEGILNLCVVLSMVKISKNQYPDIIDVDYEIVGGENSNG